MIQPTQTDEIRLAQSSDDRLERILAIVKSGQRTSFSVDDEGALRFGDRLCSRYDLPKGQDP